MLSNFSELQNVTFKRSQTCWDTMYLSQNWIWTYLEILFLSHRFPYLAASCRVTRFENHLDSASMSSIALERNWMRKNDNFYLPLNFFYVFQVWLFFITNNFWFNWKKCMKINATVMFYLMLRKLANQSRSSDWGFHSITNQLLWLSRSFSSLLVE